MVNEIVGTWKPTHRQAIFNETPLRPIGENDFATLTIRADGTGVARRKAFFAQDIPLEWSVIEEDIYLIEIVGLMRMVACVEGDQLKTGIRAEIPGMDGSGMYFVRFR